MSCSLKWELRQWPVAVIISFLAVYALSLNERNWWKYYTKITASVACWLSLPSAWPFRSYIDHYLSRISLSKMEADDEAIRPPVSVRAQCTWSAMLPLLRLRTRFQMISRSSVFRETSLHLVSLFEKSWKLFTENLTNTCSKVAFTGQTPANNDIWVLSCRRGRWLPI